MTAALLSPAIAWQQISACTDRTLTITCEDSEVISYQDRTSSRARRHASPRYGVLTSNAVNPC